MSILIVGNLVKDVYLGIDDRTNPLESDKFGTKWLDLSFNSSEHHFFNRVSTFGGAAVTLEVLTKLGLTDIAISGTNFTLLGDPDPDHTTLATSYRYIFTHDESAVYFSDSKPRSADFSAPTTPLSYLYIDPSAYLDAKTTAKITSYLYSHPTTRLILCLDHTDHNNHLAPLIQRANLIITDPDPPLTHGKLPYPTAIGIYKATMFALCLKGYSEKDARRLARLNVQHSRLSSTLTMTELTTLATQPDRTTSLEFIAASLMAPGRGILAADESGGSIKRKFAALGIPDTFLNRHIYRNIFFTTPDIEQYLSGVILFDETARDHMDDLTAIPDFLIGKRIIPGIKVDEGLAPMNDLGETYTKGLDTLPARLSEYYNMGLRFAKWRAAFRITQSDGVSTPTKDAILENCQILAKYAKECQKAGLVPIVEPEVVYDGDYSIEQSFEVTSHVLDTLSAELAREDVNLRALLFKINMISAGKKYHEKSTSIAIGEATSILLNTYIPVGTAGVVFLSGGHSPEESTAALAAIIDRGPYPFPVTFSFARALQDPALYTWQGDKDNLEKARQAFLDRLLSNTKALA
ncbi:fructose-bisphosphate aldolase class I [Candidatus Saccharibacteria bacterium]|nr:fructose-bisphosphate aldolase class I [Candidatus Saccharibacteria bacterium]